MRFFQIMYVRPEKAQNNLHICAEGSEPLLVELIVYEC